jgi:hypothetical protein
MSIVRYLPLLLAPLATGCIGTVADVVTAPVRVAGGAVDMATTSQSESDEKRGRAMRKHDEKLGKLERRYERERKDCARGDDNACKDARETYRDIEDLRAERP